MGAQWGQPPERRSSNKETLAKTWGTKTTESSGFQPRKMRLHQQTSGSDSYNKQHTWSGLATTENQPAQFAPFLISLWKTTLWMGVTPYSSNHREKNTNMSMHTEPLRSKLSQTIFTVVASAATRLGCIDVPSRRELTTANNDSAACSGHYTCLEYTQTFISLSTHKNHGPAAATTKNKFEINLEFRKNEDSTPDPPNTPTLVGSSRRPVGFRTAPGHLQPGPSWAVPTLPWPLKKNKNLMG